MTIDILGSMGRLLSAQSPTVSALLGETEEGTSAGMRAIVPALLASVVSKGADARGARELMGKLTTSTVDTSITGNLTSLLANRGGLASLIETGQGLLGFLMGGRTGQVSDAVSRVAGIKPSSASSLLGMAAPLLFSFLKKQVIDGGLDAGGLKSLLMGQTQQLQKMDIDPRITSAMGIPDLQDVLGLHGRRVPDAIDDASPLARGPISPPERSWIGWLVGLGAAALIAGVLWSMFGKPRDVGRTPTPGAIADVSAAGRMNVYFDPGRAALDADDWQVIDSIAATARSRERTVVLTGSTSRTGDARQNLALVEQRVAAIRDGLVSKGVPDARIVVQPPMPATDTEARAQRVQIDLRPGP